MSEVLKTSIFSMQSHIDSNRTKLDESLVSLRLMKQIDEFLDLHEVNQREFASHLGFTEAYISQLMSGTKKFNTSFIKNKFEKIYNVEFDFKINYKRNESFFTDISNSSMQINVNVFNVNSSELTYSFENSYVDFSSMEAEKKMLKLNYDE